MACTLPLRSRKKIAEAIVDGGFVLAIAAKFDGEATITGALLMIKKKAESNLLRKVDIC